jgi:hypothetical protein
MKAHTKKFMARLDKAFTSGNKSDDQGTKNPQFFQTMQLFIAMTEYFLPIFKEVFQSREHFVAMIDKLDPNEKEYPMVLSFVDNLPKFGRHVACELSVIGKNNTVATRSGRPRSLAPKDEKEVIGFISDRQQQNPYETLSLSQDKAAKKFKISPRTCRRIWNGRHEPHLRIEDMTNIFMSFLQTASVEAQQKAKTKALAANLR